MGIQENTAVTRAAVWDRSIESVIQLRSLVLQNPELARAYRSFRAGELHTLTEDEQFEARFLLFKMFNTFEDERVLRIHCRDMFQWPMTRRMTAIGCCLIPSLIGDD